MLALFLAFHALLWLPWWMAASRRPGGLSAAERLLQATIFYLAQVISSTWLLALAGWLKPWILFGVNLAAAVVILCRARRCKSHGSVDDLGCAGRQTEPAASHPALEIRLFIFAAGGLLALALAFTLWHGFVYAPFTYDDLNYRLPIAAWMLQNGGYAIRPAHMDILDTYPRAMECWFFWFLAFFRRDTWVDLAQLPFLGVAMLALYAAARRLGSSRPASLAAALLFPFAPVVLAQALTAYADIGFTALILAALANLLWLRRSPGMMSRISFGLALGLIMGTKFTGAPYAAIFLGFYVAAQWRRGEPSRRLLAGSLAVALPMLLAGGYAYLRNAMLYGNPLAPYKVSILGLTLPGTWDPAGGLGMSQTAGMTTLERFARSWGAVGEVSNSSLFGGFGLAWPVLAPCCFGSLVLALRRRQWGRVGVFALVLLLFLATPLNFRTRYVIFLLGLGCLSYAHLLDAAASSRWRFGLIGLGMLACVATFGQVYGKYYGRLLTMDARARRQAADPCRAARPREYRDAYRWVRGAMREETGRTVIYFGRQEIFAYCLWNERFTNRVVFAEPGDEGHFLELARSRPEDWLLLTEGTSEWKWFQRHRASFETLFEKGKTAVVQWK